MKPRHSRSVVALLFALATSAVLVAQSFNAQETIPFDAAVRTAKLPNGLTHFIRHNTRPAHRVTLRLAVKAGTLLEAGDQLRLAYLIEHMASNGRAHFKPSAL